MVRLRIKEILEEQNHTKYWLHKQLPTISYQNLSRIMDNQVQYLNLETLDRLSQILKVPVGDLFEDNTKEIISSPSSQSDDDFSK